MKKLVMLAVAMTAIVLFSGCVQMHMESTVADDGSGVASMTVSFSEGVAEALAEMKELGMDEDSGQEIPSFDDINKEDLEKAAKGHGVKVKTFTKGAVDGRETLDIVLEFDDLKSLSYVMSTMSDEDTGEGFGIFAVDGGNFILKQTTYDFPAREKEVTDEAAATEDAAPTPPAEMDPEQMQRQMAVMGKLMGAMAELDVSLKITVPGDVVSSNAPTVEGRTSIWTVNASNMMSQSQDMTPEIVFAGAGLKIKPIKE
jgi:hypothetical protein